MNAQTTPSEKTLNLTKNKDQIFELLRDKPLIFESILTLLVQFEQTIIDSVNAHCAEETFIESLRKLGTSMMHEWAKMAQNIALEKLDSTYQKHSNKKLSWYSTFGKITLVQQVMRVGRRGDVIHPFRDFADITNRGSSISLQRRITDFSSERSYQQTAAALKEHYGIDIPLYTIDSTTTRIAIQAKQYNSTMPSGMKIATTLISEVDGSMVPIVSIKDDKTMQSEGLDVTITDKRKRRNCHWKEMRLCITRVPESLETYYGIAVGEPHIVGCMMLECAKHKGYGDDTYIHAIADGATWIADQYEEQFGTNHRFYVDFFHVCEYLAAAVNSSTLSKTERKEWLEKQKINLRQSEMNKVIEMLENLKIEKQNPEHKNKERGAIEIALHYLRERKGQFEYKAAIDKKLPIGSGEVESGHRHIIQKRLKIPGAWWRLENAEGIAQLRAMRTNNRWNEFWQKKCA